MKSIKDFNVENKKVLLRCDFNVPVDASGNILDDFRIQKSLPTIRYLLEHKAKIIIATHLGEPNGRVFLPLSLKKVKERVSELLEVDITLAPGCIGPNVENMVLELLPGEILLLENIRFNQGEEENDPDFAKKLADLGELFINDAFSDCHRPHASMVSVPTYLPHGAGLLLEDEIKNLSQILENPKKPLVVLVGGKKVSTKAPFIEKISHIADVVLVSGLIKKELTDASMQLDSKNLIGPEDNLEAGDIDQSTIEIFKKNILAAKTVVWNGPFGKFEDQEFKKGTLEIAKAIIESKAFSVAGGGETIEFLRQEGMLDKFSHVSTGGGAMLDYLSDGQLPGLEALEK